MIYNRGNEGRSVPVVAGGNEPWALFVALGLQGVLYDDLEVVHDNEEERWR